MHTRSLPALKSVLGRCLSLVLALTLAGGASARQLDPPPGPIKPTMTRLDQIESRVCLNTLPGSQEAVCVVSQPGQYFLSGDMQCPSGKTCILVTTTGDVSIDLNGFSLHGASGAVAGISMISGLSLEVFGSKKGYDYYQAQSSISGFERGISSGAVVGIVVGACTIADCGQACVHLHAQNIVHRDLACRNILLSDALHVELDAPQFASGPRQTTSLDCSRCVVDGATGRGLYVSTPSGGCRLTINGSNFSNTGSHGVQVVQQAGGVVPVNDPPTLSVTDCRMSSCAGDGIHLEGSGDQATGRKGMNSNVRSTALLGCDRGMSASHLDLLDCYDMSISDCTSNGAECRNIGKAKIEECKVQRCQASGIIFSDCDGVSCINVAAGDVNGDGIQCQRPGPTKFSHIVLKRCGGNGLSTTDCDDTSCSDVSVSHCTGDGISYIWTQPGGVNTNLITHELTHVTQCGGAGLRCALPLFASSTSLSLSNCDFSSNLAEGAVVSCPSPTSSCRMKCGTVKFFNNAKGFGFVAHPDSPVSIDLSDCDLSSNTGDGLSVASSEQGASLHNARLVCSTTHLRSNGGMGCASSSPLSADRCDISGNGLNGLLAFCDDPFTSTATLTHCVFQKNAGSSVRVPRGRFASVSCEITDGGSHGIESAQGCALLTDCRVQRCAGDGVHVSGTLTIQGGAMRRNQGAGVRCTSASCVAADCSIELNGAGAAPGTPGAGGMVFTDCTTVSLQRCVVSNNTGDGVSCSSSVGPMKWMSPECLFQRNTGNGLHLDDCDDADVSRCVASSNGLIGIWGSTHMLGGRIAGCTCNGNGGGGVRVDGTGNLVVGNSASSSNSAIPAFAVAQGNAAGPIVDSSSLSTSCNPNSNIVH